LGECSERSSPIKKFIYGDVFVIVFARQEKR